MHTLKIPGSPNWYLSSVFTCAPDNTIVYAATGNNINVIYPTDSTEPANIHTTFRFHIKKIVAIDINHSNWGNPNKLVATVGDDKLVKLLDLERKTVKKHSEHLNDQNDTLVSVSIAGDRIISVSENGVVVIWQPEINSTKRIQNLFAQKVKVTCMSSCPHAKSITAFGLVKGTVVIADLRNPPRILYKMTKHQESIVNFSWCPAPINIFKSNTDSSGVITIKATSPKVENNPPEEENVLKDTENIIEQITNVEIPKYGTRKQAEYQKVDKKNLWTNLNYDDSDEEVHEQQTVHLQEKNFLQECQNLRKAILGDSDENDSLKSSEDKENVNAELLSEAMSNISINKKTDSELEMTEEDSCANHPQKRFIKEDDTKEYLLASVCSKGDICIWRTSNGRLQQKISSFAKKNKNQRSSHNCWSCVYWLRPDMLLTSSCDNKVYSMQFITGEELTKNPSKTFNSRLIHADHNQPIFAITCPFKLYSSYEVTTLDDLKDSCVWTTSKDRLIICTELGPERKTLISYPTFGTTIVYMALSSIDPTKLAMGLSDGVIRFWDLSLNETHVILMSKNQEKNRQRISYLDWHPVKENLLAYSTVEGQLGIIDVKNLGKPATKFTQYHSKHVYRIQWAPLPFEEGLYGLYSSSGGQLVVHNEKKATDEAMKIDIDNCHVSTFSWNEDTSILAVGSREGQVKLLGKNFSVYETFYMQKKAVQCVQWHPLSTANDTGLSPFANYLAVATNEKDIYIYNCLHVEQKDANNSSELVAVLKGQVGAVKHVCWSPHDGERIVAATEYGMANVYNVVTKTLISSCRCNSMYTGIVWSPLHQDLILSGNFGHTLTIWNLLQNDPMFTIVDEDEEKDTKQKNSDNDDNESVTSENTGSKKKKKPYTLSKVCHLQRMKHIELYKKLLDLNDKNQDDDDDDENDSSSSSSSENEDSLNKQENISRKKDIKPLEAVQIFGNRKDALLILQHEDENHLSKENWDQMINIGLWRGDTQKTFETLLARGTINPWMIQVAPMISHQLYSELCLKYADKLCELGNGAEASNYYLLCHQVLKAIDALCSSNMYRDALILAKCRLPIKDPKIVEIYEKWLKNSIIVGNYEEAAQCYIKLKKLSEAGELLSKRANKEVLDIAAELAKRSNNTDLLNAVKIKIENLNRVENSPDSSAVLHVSESRFSAIMEKMNEKTDDE